MPVGYKKVCFNCKKAFSLGTDFLVNHSATCPECGQRTAVLQHSFRPPRRDDTKKWEVVEFLKNNGFVYQHVYSTWTGKTYEGLVNYPQTMAEAKAFVAKYKSQAYISADT